MTAAAQCVCAGTSGAQCAHLATHVAALPPRGYLAAMHDTPAPRLCAQHAHWHRRLGCAVYLARQPHKRTPARVPMR